MRARLPDRHWQWTPKVLAEKDKIDMKYLDF